MHSTEHSPLLRQNLVLTYPGSKNQEKVDDDISNSRHRYEIIKEEAQQLLHLTLPVVGTFLLEFAPGLVSILLVGHMPKDGDEEKYLDATALAVTYINLTGLSIGCGLATALDTLCSQAVGAKKFKQLGIYLQTGIIVLSIAFLASQPPAVALYAGQFARWTLPGIPFILMYELLKKVSQAQNIAAPMFWVAVAGNILNALLGYLFIFHTSIGFLGAALARTLSNMFFLIALLGYLYWKDMLKDFWDGWHWEEAVAGISQFFKLGVPGMLMMCFEWWAFEIIVLLAGWLPDGVVAIGANSVVQNVSAMSYMVYVGISVAANVRIGNALGANHPNRAKICTAIAVVYSLVAGCAMAVLMYLGTDVIPPLFTNDPAINSLVTKVLRIASFYQIVDAPNAVVQGAFGGSGRQSLGAMINFVAYYLVGIPLGAFLEFSWDFGLIGLWGGYTAGISLSCTVGLLLLAFSKWEKLAWKAQQRLHLEKIAPEDQNLSTYA